MSLIIPCTPFERLAVRYLRHQRALGKRSARPTWVIGTLARFLARRGAMDLDAQEFEAWCCERQHTNPTARRSEALIIRRLCLYRRRTEPDCFVPDPRHFPRRVPAAAPVIFGPAEVARMLRTIEVWPPHPQLPLRRAALRIAVVLLYTAGLRRGELAHLTLADVELRRATIQIRESKFHKSRIVPLSTSAQRELRAYLQMRLAPPWDLSANSPLLGHHHGFTHFRGYSSGSLGRALRQLLEVARVHDEHGRRARVHDFRHSFAVQALLRWYRAGIDVQAKLPHLAMYMGHVSIVSTAYYLHFIPEIAMAANRRFERHFGHLIEGGQP